MVCQDGGLVTAVLKQVCSHAFIFQQAAIQIQELSKENTPLVSNQTHGDLEMDKISLAVETKLLKDLSKLKE